MLKQNKCILSEDKSSKIEHCARVCSANVVLFFMNFQIHESVTKYMFVYHCTLDTIKMCKVYLLTGPNKSAAHIYVPALILLM